MTLEQAEQLRKKYSRMYDKDDLRMPSQTEISHILDMLKKVYKSRVNWDFAKKIAIAYYN